MCHGISYACPLNFPIEVQLQEPHNITVFEFGAFEDVIILKGSQEGWP